MNIDLLAQFALLTVSAIIGLLSAIAQLTGYSLFDILRRNPKQPSLTPCERVQKSIENLRRASEDADVVIKEIVTDISKREAALAELEAKNKELADQEETLRKRIDSLKDVPVEVAEYFQKINQQNLEQMDKRGGRRDFTFFILGVVLSAAVSITLKLIGLG